MTAGSRLFGWRSRALGCRCDQAKATPAPFAPSSPASGACSPEVGHKGFDTERLRALWTGAWNPGCGRCLVDGTRRSVEDNSDRLSFLS